MSRPLSRISTKGSTATGAAEDPRLKSGGWQAAAVEAELERLLLYSVIYDGWSQKCQPLADDKRSADSVATCEVNRALYQPL